MSFIVDAKENYMNAENLMHYIETHTVFWQTKTYSISPGSSPSNLIPGHKLELTPGLYFFWYGWVFMWTYISSDYKFGYGTNDKGGQYKTLRIMTFRWHYYSFINFFRENMRKRGDVSLNDPKSIYIHGGYNGWQNIGPLNTRRLSTVILPKGKKEQIILDIQTFLKPETREFYANKGITYKRGILLYGKPGSP